MGFVDRIVRLFRKPGSRAASDAPTREEEMVATFVGLGLPASFVTAPGGAGEDAARDHVYAAYEHMAAGHNEKAIEALRAGLGLPGLVLDPRVVGVCRFLLAGCLLRVGQAGEAVIELVKAHEAYPDHPGVREAFEQVKDVAPDMGARAAALPAFYAPSLDGAEEAQWYTLAATHDAVLCTHPAPERQAGNVKYRYTLAVYPRGAAEAVLYVAAEVNGLASRPGGGGSHFLGVFPGDGHVNMGASDDWADRDKFEARALEVACTRLGLEPKGVERRSSRP